MPENIPLKIKLALCIFKALNNKTCDKICQLILLLYREFYITVTAEIDFKSIKLKIKRRGEHAVIKEFNGIRGIKKTLQELVDSNTIDKENID